jgi:ActR/RegA family two-component response regulator
MTETPEQMHARLCGVIGQAQFSVLDEPYAWQPMARTAALSDNALAAVRDGTSWAALLPAKAAAPGAYRVFAFHFAEGSNASGFVAWLASLMKAEAGTGAMVVCGYDARATDALWQTSFGLFDYWGCPWSKGDAVIALVQRLRDAGSSKRSPD